MLFDSTLWFTAMFIALPWPHALLKSQVLASFHNEKVLAKGLAKGRPISCMAQGKTNQSFQKKRFVRNQEPSTLAET